MPQVWNYSTYFSRTENDPVTNGYDSWLALYVINMVNPTAEKSPDNISKEIYAAAMEGIPTAYFLWHPTAGLVDES